MYRRNLLSTLALSSQQWWQYRKISRRFGKWLARGTALLTADRKKFPDFPATLIVLAIVEGAEEMLIAPRVLRGIRSIETPPAFWKPDWGNAMKEGIEQATPEDETPEKTAQRLYHFAKWHAFSRYDVYRSNGGVVELCGGYDITFFADMPRIIGENLKEPRKLAIVNEHDDFVPAGKFCTVSLSTHACGVQVGNDAIGLKFVYE